MIPKDKMKRISQTAAYFLEENLKSLLALGAALAVAVGAAALFFYFQKEKEKTAAEALYKRHAALDRAGQKVNGKDYRAFAAGRFFFQGKAASVYSDEMKKAAARLEESALTHARRKATTPFAAGLSDFYFKNGETEKARAFLENFLRQVEGSPLRASRSDKVQSAGSRRARGGFLYRLIRLQLASFYMDERLCDQALPVLEEALSGRPDFLEAEIHLKRGLCFEETGRAEEAESAYKKAMENKPEDLTAAATKDRLLFLRLQREFTEESPVKKSHWKKSHLKKAAPSAGSSAPSLPEAPQRGAGPQPASPPPSPSTP